MLKRLIHRQRKSQQGDHKNIMEAMRPQKPLEEGRDKKWSVL
jgi:hypothetical protein